MIESSVPPPEIALSQTILLVEDESIVRRVMKSLLLKEGYTVLSAPSGAEALDYCKAQQAERIDLLITDLHMPDMNGPDLAQLLTALIPGIKVLYISGYSRDAALEQRLLKPDFNFLEKADVLKGLAAEVRKVLLT